jgi:chorismate-pyruvate lyase
MQDVSGLPPFLRVLLTTDGVVTQTLAAWFGEPIDVDVLSHCESRSERSYPEVGVAIGDRILSRRVVLRGRVTHEPYAVASSVVVSDSLPPEVRRRLVEERKGIGELLSASRLETYRELIAIRNGDAAERACHLGVVTGARVVSRIYKIHLNGRAAMLIEEAFAEERFAG